jgi:site-specific DNA recombinase
MRIDEPRAEIVRRVFRDVAAGQGLNKIARALTTEKVPSPSDVRRAGAETRRLKKLAGKDEAVADVVPAATGWTASTVHEILHRETYRGVIIYGRSKNGRTKKLRAKVDSSKWLRREDESVRIVSNDEWNAAHAALTERGARLLRQGHQFIGKPESFRGTRLLSFLAVCGICAGPLIATSRGKAGNQVYVCRRHKTHGCSNGTGVPQDLLNWAVIRAMKQTFDPAALEQFLAAKANDVEARERRDAERERLLERLPAIEREIENLGNAIAAGVALNTVAPRLKERAAERDEIEARLAALDDAARDLQADADTLEKLREKLPDWLSVLDDDPALARQVLKKLLARPIVVTPDGDGYWRFEGESHLDGVLRGAVAADLSAMIKAAWKPTSPARPIAGGSDARSEVYTVDSSEGPPKPPDARRCLDIGDSHWGPRRVSQSPSARRRPGESRGAPRRPDQP